MNAPASRPARQPRLKLMAVPRAALATPSTEHVTRPLWLAVLGVLIGATAVWFSPNGSPRAAQIEDSTMATAQATGDDLVSVPFLSGAGQGAEGQLILAYASLAKGDVRKAQEQVEALVQAHPEFALAQMLYGDLLLARSGKPTAFANVLNEDAAAPRPDTEALREQALRRLAALRERPPTDRVPKEFVNLPAHVKHAVAVDTSRSRLYLFANGPEGMKLERDFYVSLGKQGIDKQVEGDARTPLGVYWITNSLPANLLDERFGKGALGLNYPNGLDKLKGRTGAGLFLHGVPPSVHSHGLWATDGCVALANEDVETLMQKLDVDDSPVVISRQLEWVPLATTQQVAAEFRPAFQAWDDARRSGDLQDLQRWYDPEVRIPRHTAANPEPRSEVSFMAWYGDGNPMMIVTERQAPKTPGEATMLYRQYWVNTGGRWRIAVDGALTATVHVASR